MTTPPPLAPPASTARPLNDTPDQIMPPGIEKKRAIERSDRDEALALDIVKVIAPLVATSATGTTGAALGHQIAAACEVAWRWVTTENWTETNQK